MENSEEKPLNTSIRQKVEEEKSKIMVNGIDTNESIDRLYKLIDIHKDIANENYWKVKEDNMRNRMYGANRYSRDAYGTSVIDNYGNYGRRMRDSRGRYMGENEIHRKSEEFLEALNEHYGNYSLANDMASRGNYGSKEESIESLNDMLDSVVDFMVMLKREAKSQDEIDLIKRYAQTITEI